MIVSPSGDSLLVVFVNQRYLGGHQHMVIGRGGWTCTNRRRCSLAFVVSTVVASLVACLGAGSAAASQGPLVYHGGPVLTDPSTTYFIYWQGQTGTLPSTYVPQLAQFIDDWSGSTAHGVLTQYFQHRTGKQYVSNAVTYGGTIVDNTAFPRAQLQDGDIAREVRTFVSVRHLPEGLRVNYAVLLPEQESIVTACAWHEWVPDTASGGMIFYSIIPYYDPNAAYTRSTGCNIHAPGPYPHGEAIDNGIDMLSHELAEIATDPVHMHGTSLEPGQGWRANAHKPADQSEIGDICRWVYGPREATGADVYLNGHAYLIQGEWSNADGGCSLGPTLGRSWAPNQEGYGQVKPTTIFNGGDPTGLVQRVRWTHWGQRKAIGRGTGDWVWPGESVGTGSIRTRARVVAWDLGFCGAQLSYRRLTWFFASRGETFNPSEWIDPCTGAYSPYKPPRHCGGVTIRSPRGYARDVQVQGIGCGRARSIIASSPSVRYLYRGESRFRHAGLYCGTQGYGSPPTLFDCARGRVDIFYDVS